MFLPFFETLRKTGIPVSLREFISFLDAVQTGMVIYDLEGFYYLARTIMVKDERHLDRFDRAFQTSFKGLENLSDADILNAVDIPFDWLKKMAEKHLSPEEKAEIEYWGGVGKLRDTLRQRLKAQEKRHQGGSKLIGAAASARYADR